MILMTQEIKNQLLESSYYPKEEDWMETTVIVKYFILPGLQHGLLLVEKKWMETGCYLVMLH